MPSGIGRSTPMFNRSDIRAEVESIAPRNVFIGTSSWKYPGWCGQIYDEQQCKSP